MCEDKVTGAKLLLGELEELIKHGLRALRDTLPSEVELTTKVIGVHIYREHMSDIIYLPSCIILGLKKNSDFSFCCRIAH